MLELIKSLFTWLGEVLEDPNDKQGSTKRLCLLLFLTTVMLLIAIITLLTTPIKFPDIPESVLSLYKFTLLILTGASVGDKLIAAYKLVNGGDNADQPDK
jgi:hypothetical protein